MATRLQLSSTATPGYTHVDNLSNETAEVTAELLTANHYSYHTKWKATFHNHLVHHLLALWALGASPQEVRDMWNLNAAYQAPLEAPEKTAIPEIDLNDASVFVEYLGQNDRYADYLTFFEREIDQKGVSTTLNQYLLKGDHAANDAFYRLFSDLLHPLIHLGCGLEFNQPKIIAEALAGACVHESWPGTFLAEAETLVQKNTSLPSKTLLEVLHDLAADLRVKHGVKHTDPFNKIADGLLTRVSADRLAAYIAQFRLTPNPTSDELRSKMIDLMYTCAYMIGAAQRPGKREAMDFVTLHTATTCVFYPAILSQESLSNSDKARILEASARTSAVMYASCGSPKLHTGRILDYAPRHPEGGWEALFRRAICYPDEGHAAKLMRALYCAEQLGEPAPGFPIAKVDLIKIAHMGMDSVEAAFDEISGNKVPAAASAILQRVGFGGEMVANNMTRWVYYGGLEHAWDHIPDLE
ncbi:hypothetical protein F4777DRAFT_580269 [Nemania sp. FL0916]|nr:hypothetical protein F4777DRAFT_580269 [Nemania sp. FL0916]